MISEATYQVTLEMPREQAWKTLEDLSQAHNYVPGIIKTEIVSSNKQGVGASRLVYQGKKRALQETVTDWDEGSGFRIRLHKGEKDSPFKNAFFRYLIEESDGDTTRLTTTMGYTPPLGWFGILLDKLFLNKIISGVIRDVALSMKHFYETGKPTTPKDLKAIKAQLA